MAEVGKDNYLNERWLHTDFPNIIKTHELRCINELYSQTKSIYVLRDPRDTLISYFHYRKNLKRNTFTGEFNDFIFDEENGIQAYNKHVSQWLPYADHIFTYEELMTNSLKVFTQFFNQEGYNIDDEIIIKSIRLSSPSTLKAIEEAQSRPNNDVNFKEGFKFVRDSRISQWKSCLSDSTSRTILNASHSKLQEIYA